jgi:uncharacterized protein YndB with AHSA1/START domain
VSAAKVIGIGCGGCLGLVILALVVGYFALPDSYEVERSIDIAAPASTVYPLVNTPARWPEWDAWTPLDPDMEVEMTGPESGVGSKRAWDSDHDQVGRGSFTITESVPNERVVMELEFPDMQMTSTGTFTFERSDLGTRVTWHDHAELSGPMKFFALAADAMIGPMFELGLGNLKELAEKEVDADDVLRDEIEQAGDEAFEKAMGEAEEE